MIMHVYSVVNKCINIYNMSIHSLKLLTSFPIVSTLMSIQISRSQNQATARSGTTWCLSTSCRSQGWLPGNDHFFEWYTPENAQFAPEKWWLAEYFQTGDRPFSWGQAVKLQGLITVWPNNIQSILIFFMMDDPSRPPCLNDWQIQLKWPWYLVSWEKGSTAWHSILYCCITDMFIHFVPLLGSTTTQHN